MWRRHIVVFLSLVRLKHVWMSSQAVRRGLLGSWEVICCTLNIVFPSTCLNPCQSFCDIHIRDCVPKSSCSLTCWGKVGNGHFSIFGSDLETLYLYRWIGSWKLLPQNVQFGTANRGKQEGNRETSALTIIYDTSTANYINFHYICRGSHIHRQGWVLTFQLGINNSTFIWK